MTVWQFLTETLNTGCHIIAVGGAYIRQQRIPLAIFPLRTVLGVGFHALIALTLAIAFTVVLRGTFNPLLLLQLVPGIVLLFLLGWCFAILTGIMNTLFPDTVYLLEICLQILFYVTPILYRPGDIAGRGRLIQLVEWNPFTSIMSMIRTPILEGTMPPLDHALISLGFLALVGTAAVLLLRKWERTLIFWI
jgi:lipopolysaccharide transport system permease protein